MGNNLLLYIANYISAELDEMARHAPSVARKFAKDTGPSEAQVDEWVTNAVSAFEREAR